MKVVSALKRRCKGCYIVRKGKKVYVKCELSPRHKQRQGFATFTPPPEPSSFEFRDWLADLLAFEMVLIRPYVLSEEAKKLAKSEE